jgi:hypothetical protein
MDGAEGFMSPFGIWQVKCLTVIYDVRDLGLKRLGRVSCCGLEVGCTYEI